MLSVACCCLLRGRCFFSALSVHTLPQQPTVGAMGVLIDGGTVPTPVGPTGGYTPERVVGLASWLPFLFSAQDRERNSRSCQLVRDQPIMKAAGNRLITKRSRRHTTRLRWGAVNVRTMQTKIRNSGGELCFEGADPTKPYQICDLLATHDISLCAMSEVRWKGQGTLCAGDYVYLFSGLPEDAPMSLYGVATALNPDMQKAWKAAGSQVSYFSLLEWATGVGSSPRGKMQRRGMLQQIWYWGILAWKK